MRKGNLVKLLAGIMVCAMTMGVKNGKVKPVLIRSNGVDLYVQFVNGTGRNRLVFCSGL